MQANRGFLWALCVVFAVAGCVPSHPQAIRVADYTRPIRVACVGDSITYGAGIEDRQNNHYPVQLGRLLGNRWEVRNFGVSGATLLRSGDLPYWKQAAFEQALAFDPDVVIIKLGTNDTKPQNWRYGDQFIPDYKDLIRTFAAVPAKPRIWICVPVPVYENRWGISAEVLNAGVIPRVRRVAQDMGVGLIDLNAPLSDRPDLFPDKIHPNAAGAKVMAEVIHATLAGAEVPTAR